MAEWPVSLELSGDAELSGEAEDKDSAPGGAADELVRLRVLRVAIRGVAVPQASRRDATVTIAGVGAEADDDAVCETAEGNIMGGKCLWDPQPPLSVRARPSRGLRFLLQGGDGAALRLCELRLGGEDLREAIRGRWESAPIPLVPVPAAEGADPEEGAAFAGEANWGTLTVAFGAAKLRPDAAENLEKLFQTGGASAPLHVRGRLELTVPEARGLPAAAAPSSVFCRIRVGRKRPQELVTAVAKQCAKEGAVKFGDTLGFDVTGLRERVCVKVISRPRPGLRSLSRGSGGAVVGQLSFYVEAEAADGRFRSSRGAGWLPLQEDAAPYWDLPLRPQRGELLLRWTLTVTDGSGYVLPKLPRELPFAAVTRQRVPRAEEGEAEERARAEAEQAAAAPAVLRLKVLACQGLKLSHPAGGSSLVLRAAAGGRSRRAVPLRSVQLPLQRRAARGGVARVFVHECDPGLSGGGLLLGTARIPYEAAPGADRGRQWYPLEPRPDSQEDARRWQRPPQGLGQLLVKWRLQQGGPEEEDACCAPPEAIPLRGGPAERVAAPSAKRRLAPPFRRHAPAPHPAPVAALGRGRRAEGPYRQQPGAWQPERAVGRPLRGRLRPAPGSPGAGGGLSTQVDWDPPPRSEGSPPPPDYPPPHCAGPRPPDYPPPRTVRDPDAPPVSRPRSMLQWLLGRTASAPPGGEGCSGGGATAPLSPPLPGTASSPPPGIAAAPPPKRQSPAGGSPLKQLLGADAAPIFPGDAAPRSPETEPLSVSTVSSQAVAEPFNPTAIDVQDTQLYAVDPKAHMMRSASPSPRTSPPAGPGVELRLWPSCAAALAADRIELQELLRERDAQAARIRVLERDATTNADMIRMLLGSAAPPPPPPTYPSLC